MDPGEGPIGGGILEWDKDLRLEPGMENIEIIMGERICKDIGHGISVARVEVALLFCF